MNTRHGSAIVTTPSDREIVITRAFAAPLDLVWEAMTTPRHVLRWWGPAWSPLVSCEIDLRVGGSWRYVSLAPDGNELGWHGTYREIESPVRVVSTEVFEGFPDAESVNTMTLTHTDGVTTAQTVVLHSSREHRDGHLESGMEPGMQDTFDRLEDLLAVADTPAERFRRVAGRFSDRAAAVAPPAAWDNPAPCDGWVARDIVRHMVEWMPAFLHSVGVELPPGPSVDADPPAAWEHLADSIQRLLDDPATANREITHEHLGTTTVSDAISTIMFGDVVIHTWDLARATGLDESLDPAIVHEMLLGMLPMDDDAARRAVSTDREWPFPTTPMISPDSSRSPAARRKRASGLDQARMRARRVAIALHLGDEIVDRIEPHARRAAARRTAPRPTGRRGRRRSRAGTPRATNTPARRRTWAGDRARSRTAATHRRRLGTVPA